MRRRNRHESGRAYSPATSRAQIPALFRILEREELLRAHDRELGYEYQPPWPFPVLFPMLVPQDLCPGQTNLDIGGGRWDYGTTFLRRHGVKNLVFDPGNRSREHNRRVIRQLEKCGADTATIANVLNVIPNLQDRMAVLRFAKQYTRGPVFIMSYEGDRSSRTKRTRDGWQLNRPAAAYLPEIRKAFRNVERYGQLIVAED